ncbi:hypothetical protein BFS06_12330 [Clostridium perfringens]|uniref:Uncharacterized protein n=1 Tax=Clostridium perfringens TaxID=1502 RepID=A0A140GR33_CLOPF|nr:hypothetical protein [Clostridium perfringens]AMN30992.1 hypothetical protein JFP838_pA0076 [Clostridium perfringens]TBX14988.1 hypothetical protein BFS06_12330 [Clostridium perfringens]
METFNIRLVYINFSELQLIKAFEKIGWRYIKSLNKDTCEFKGIIWYSSDILIINELFKEQKVRVFCAKSLNGDFCIYLFFTKFKINNGNITINFRHNAFRRFYGKLGGFITKWEDDERNHHVGNCKDNLKCYYSLYFEFEEKYKEISKKENLSIKDCILVSTKLLLLNSEKINKHVCVYNDI